MIIVSDTTPIHYLILIDKIETMPKILGDVIIPDAVFRELTTEKTPLKIKNYLAEIPSWLNVRKCPGPFDAELLDVDLGEREAIVLAEELRAELILIDDNAARLLAESRGLRVTGTLGFLKMAAHVGEVDFPDPLLRIKAAGFYISEALEAYFLGEKG